MEGARWLTASTFAIGLPRAGWLAARFRDRNLMQRSLLVAACLAAVIAPALLGARVEPMPRGCQAEIRAHGFLRDSGDAR